MPPCDPETDHRRAAMTGAMLMGASILALTIFGYIFYNLYDFAMHDLEHFNNWNQTMHQIGFICPRHWALNMRCCTCKTTDYGHCCARGW